MRDLLHPHAWQRRVLGQRLLEFLASHGYDLVDTPPFEHAEVLERGLETIDRRDLLRFVEPESGEVALLRPDITPQVARIVATQLRQRPAPWRLCYEGTVIRRRRGRARRQRQIAQAGIECIGIEGVEADVEVVALAARACEHLGLRSFRLELSQIALGQLVLAQLPEALQTPVADALASKDRSLLAELLHTSQIDDATRQALMQRLELYGDTSVLAEARSWLSTPTEQRCLERLTQAVDQLQAYGLGDKLGIDLGEVRDRAYYTGIHFSLLATGPGEAVAAGGRYDDLLGRFGMPLPASGFALDLDHLQWALDAQTDGAVAEMPVRIVWAASSAATAAAWRAQGAHVALRPIKPSVVGQADTAGFASAWGYDACLMHQGGSWCLRRLHDDACMDLARLDDDESIAAALQWIRGGRSVCQA